MATAVLQTALTTGEISPSLFGRVDLDLFHRGASTMRNMFPNYKGGSMSRAGTAFIGRCLQPGTSLPPRDIPFQFSISQGYVLEFGEQYLRFKYRGGYVLEDPLIIQGITLASPAVMTAVGNNFVRGEWVFIVGAQGLTELNQQTFIVGDSDPVTGEFQLYNIFGEEVNTLDLIAYTGAGIVSRVLTLTTPYVTADLPLLKYDQSADVMSLVHPSYPPYELVRIASNIWSLAPVQFGSIISAPTSLTAHATLTTSSYPATYSYVLTTVNQLTNEESVASDIVTVDDAADMGLFQDNLVINWSYTGNQPTRLFNLYRAPVTIDGSVPVGSLFGFIGSSRGREFVDRNFTPDFSTTPPLHSNPFAPRLIKNALVIRPGSGYTSAPTITINTSTGSGAVIEAIIIGGELEGFLIVNRGQDYGLSDTLVITGGGGSGAIGSLVFGPATGTYPSTVGYFQQRRAYAGTVNQPDTYWLSKPGAYNNMDFSPIALDSDSIVGTPWAQQVNGIQWLVPMPGGLVVLTGNGAWQVSGGGANAQITPATQEAKPQAYNGCNPEVKPITINYDILYIQAKGSIPRDLQYNFYVNIYTGTDLSLVSSHLFDDYKITQWTWAEEPYKLVWAVRDDGTMLSLTYLKEQNILGWSRHDTNGLFVSVCSITEPPIDAVYVIVKRFVNDQWVYFSERMNGRRWKTVDDCWCVDCGLAYEPPRGNATLTASSATGSLGIESITVITGGSGFVAPFVQIVDPNGTGAVCSATVTGGVITAITVDSPGAGYTSPKVRITDSIGRGATANAAIKTNIRITADAPVFTPDHIGDVVRVGNGIGRVIEFISNTQLRVKLRTPITLLTPNDPQKTPLPQPAGKWSLGPQTEVVQGLGHLEGMEVAILADGNVVPNQTVVNGQITLPRPASLIKVGLPFQVQLQSMPIDIPGETTVQGKRKNITAVTVRVQNTRGAKVGSNQVDASFQPRQANIPWDNLKQIKERGNQPNAGNEVPLFTGDERVIIPGEWKKPGQVAVQQDFPLPLNVLALIPEVNIGDDNG